VVCADEPVKVTTSGEYPFLAIDPMCRFPRRMMATPGFVSVRIRRPIISRYQSKAIRQHRHAVHGAVIEDTMTVREIALNDVHRTCTTCLGRDPLLKN
jgi:hypothetical protein